MANPDDPAMGRDVVVPANARIVDLSTQTVLPGLIDAHTHLLAAIDPKWDLGDTWIMTLQRREGFRVILGAHHAKEVLEVGFTTVRDLGNAGEYLDMDLEKAIRFGSVPGPTIIPAGRIIAPFGGQFWDTPTNPELLNSPEYYFADSQDEMRKAVRENIYWGAKVIKIVVDAQTYQYSVEDIRFIVDEAARAGLKVAAHAQTEKGAHAAIEAIHRQLRGSWRARPGHPARHDNLGRTASGRAQGARIARSRHGGRHHRCPWKSIEGYQHAEGSLVRNERWHYVPPGSSPPARSDDIPSAEDHCSNAGQGDHIESDDDACVHRADPTAGQAGRTTKIGGRPRQRCQIMHWQIIADRFEPAECRGHQPDEQSLKQVATQADRHPGSRRTREQRDRAGNGKERRHRGPHPQE